MRKFECLIWAGHEVVVLQAQGYELVVHFNSLGKYNRVEGEQQVLWVGSLLVLLKGSYWCLVPLWSLDFLSLFSMKVVRASMAYLCFSLAVGWETFMVNWFGFVWLCCLHAVA